MRALQGGVLSHSGSKGAGQGWAAHLVIDRDEVDAVCLLPISECLPGELSLRPCPCQGWGGQKWEFLQKTHGVTLERGFLYVEMTSVPRDDHALSEKTANVPRVIIAG